MPKVRDIPSAETVLKMMEFIDIISAMFQDGECEKCRNESGINRHNCDAHDEDDRFNMDADDAINVVENLIASARSISERPDFI